MAIHHIYNGGALHTILYRFTCCKCGKQTDWLEYEIRVGYIVRVSGNYSIAALHTGEQKLLTTTIERMKKNISKGHTLSAPFFEKTEFSYYLDKKCPLCGAKQPNRSPDVEYDWNGR